MCDDDELVPGDAHLRKARRISGGTLPAKHGHCRECPKHDAPRGWCPVLGEPRTGRSPMCRYGELLKRTRIENLEDAR